MTTPAKARQTGRGRFYTDSQGNRFWSVTTLLGVLPKPALIPWAARTVAEYAADNHQAVGKILRRKINGSPDPLARQEAIDLIKGAHRRVAGRAADIGTAVHQAINAYILKAPHPQYNDDVAPHMEQFEAFLGDWKPKFLASELVVYNATESYAGRLDAIVELIQPQTGEMTTLLMDVKTGKGVYPETACQIAMYRHAEYVEDAGGNRLPMPTTDGGLVLHVRPDSYALIPLQCDEQVFQTALYAREIYRWQHDIAPDVVGDPIVREESIRAH